MLWKDGERVGNLKPAPRLEPDPLLSTLPPSTIVLLLIGENLRGGFVEHLGWRVAPPAENLLLNRSVALPLNVTGH